MEFKPYKIGKYLLLERIAAGGMAEVYRAKMSGAGGFEKEVAVKKILPSYSSNEDFRRMFEYEARLSNKLNHPNIVQIFDFVKPGDSYLLAMEFVDGKNLRQLVNKIKKNNYILPIELSVYLINEVCRGLEHAHSKKDSITGKPLNIIHRDMSPQNIMISYEGAVKIVDFGIAKAKDRVDETRSGVIKGKFGYMSPEQANGEKVDHRSDIFSTGIILWELVTGRRLFATENDLATLKLIQECVIPVPSKINPKITIELEKILLKALTKDIRLRYQSAGQFQKALQEYLNRNHSAFTSDEVSKVMRNVFLTEIQAEKKRYEQAHRQSIPFSQGETGQRQPDSEGLEEALEGDQTHSEIDVDTAVTFGEDNESSVSPQSLPSAKSSSTVAKTTVTPEDELGLVKEEISKPVRKEAQEMATRVASVSNDPNESSFKREMTGSDQMPVINQKTVVSGPEAGVLDSDEEDTTGDVPITGSPITAPKSFTPTFNQRSYGSGTPSLQGPKTSNSGPSFTMEPAPQNSLELERAPEQRRSRSQEPLRRAGYQRLPKRRSSLVPFLLIFFAIGITLYLYKLLFSRELVPTIVQMVNPRTVTEVSPLPPLPVQTTPPSLGGDCVIRIDSDPPGAEVIINNKRKGTTSYTSAVPCHTDINLELKLKGHESISENLFITEREKRVLKSLKKIPLGGIELLLSHNADVYVNGLLVGSASANQPYKVDMRAGKKHKLRLRNEPLGIDSSKEVVVQEGFWPKMMVRLEENPTRKTNGKRK